MIGTALLLAAGRGERLGGVAKAFEMLGGCTLLHRAASSAAAATLVEGLVVAVPRGMEVRASAELAGLPKPVRVVTGGSTRGESCALALDVATSSAVAVHDAARALCPPRLFDDVLALLDDHDAVVAAVPVVDTVKLVDGRRVERTLDRSALAAVQTPQAFRTDVLRRAHDAARRDGVDATDDAALVERLGFDVLVVDGCAENFKVTTPLDLAVAEALLARP